MVLEHLECVHRVSEGCVYDTHRASLDPACRVETHVLLTCFGVNNAAMVLWDHSPFEVKGHPIHVLAAITDALHQHVALEVSQDTFIVLLVKDRSLFIGLSF